MHTRVLQDAGDGRYPHSRDPASTSAPDNRRGSARERSAMHGHGRAGRGQPAWHGMGSKGWAQSLDWTATENGDPPKRMERQKSDRRWLIGPFWGRYPAGHRGRWRSFGPKRQRWGGSPLPGCLHCPPAQAGTYLPWRASPGGLSYEFERPPPPQASSPSYNRADRPACQRKCKGEVMFLKHLTLGGSIFGVCQ